MTEHYKDKQPTLSNSGYDRHEINVRWVMAIAIVAVVALGVSVLVLYEYFVYEKERQIYELTLRPESELLQKMRALEDTTLTTYNLTPSVTGTYRIPIDSAMRLMVDENTHSSASREGNP